MITFRLYRIPGIMGEDYTLMAEGHTIREYLTRDWHFVEVLNPMAGSSATYYRVDVTSSKEYLPGWRMMRLSLRIDSMQTTEMPVEYYDEKPLGIPTGSARFHMVEWLDTQKQAPVEWLLTVQRTR